VASPERSTSFADSSLSRTTRPPRRCSLERALTFLDVFQLGERAPRIGRALVPNAWAGVLASPLMKNEAPQIVLREIEDRDLDVLFEHATDREAIRMAAFTSADFDDRDAFHARWARIRRDPTTTNRVIETDGRAVGHIASFDLDANEK
jgi:hypothetical protein